MASITKLNTTDWSEAEQVLFQKGIVLNERLKSTLLGEIFRADLKDSGNTTEVVVKLSNSQQQENLVTCESPAMEMKVMTTILPHQNIVEVKDGFCVGTQVQVLVLEIMKGGDLFEYLNSQRQLSEEQARLYFVQVLDALKHLNNLGFCHLDVSLENILLSEDLRTVKLADFGQARPLSNFRPFSSVQMTRPGKLLYMAPEIAASDPGTRGESADLYSLGVVLFCMLTGFHPYSHPGQNDTAYGLLRDSGVETLLEYYGISYCMSYNCCCPTGHHFLSTEAVDLLDGLLCSQSDRLTLEDVQKHPWIQIQ
jgi:serine/threonine protein kinase